ncbi:hypothetical protein BJ973_003706 [Actinoplanes tereljensis]|uniref:Trypsin-co-occurring domain-containing protein n=1 Tax=Paractinoplanes tereljensis TaxID=571912 RepID=A0A919TXL3_9ACTN|nr:trypco2 family protein [Actinoplanes tereljensis]GIF25429.1 hypothetical protein Ate02nite_81590 [Actinoplanes tereljensis]
MADTTPGVPLADLIDAVRAELQVAALRARDEDLQFEVNDVQLEVEIATTGTKGGEGGLKIWVINIGAKGEKSNASTQRVTLSLGPVTRDGTKFTVSAVGGEPVRRD